LRDGDLVEVTGITSPGDVIPVVVTPVITKKGATGLPAAPFVPLRELGNRATQYAWVETEGIIRSAQIDPLGDLRLDIAHEGERLDVWMRGYNGVSFARLVDARYRFTG